MVKIEYKLDPNFKRLYCAWANMKKRCNGTDNRSYRYAGRGITYTPKWETFNGFYEDMASTYRDGLSLDRIDNDGNYDKENCRWSTPTQQANNRETNRLFTINGETRTIAEWSRLVDIKPSTIRQRIYCYKWPIIEALGLRNN